MSDECEPAPFFAPTVRTLTDIVKQSSRTEAILHEKSSLVEAARIDVAEQIVLRHRGQFLRQHTAAVVVLRLPRDSVVVRHSVGDGRVDILPVAHREVDGRRRRFVRHLVHCRLSRRLGQDPFHCGVHELGALSGDAVQNVLCGDDSMGCCRGDRSVVDDVLSGVGDHVVDRLFGSGGQPLLQRFLGCAACECRAGLCDEAGRLV